MDPSIYIIALQALAGCAVAVWAARRKKSHQGLLQAWQGAVASCRLQTVETGPPLRARAGPMEVRLDTLGREDQDTQLTIVVPGPPNFSKVRIRPEVAHPLQYQWVPEVETGDEPFDKTFCIEGPAQMVIASLDARTRQLLLHVNARSRLEISLGEIRAVVRLPWQVSQILPLLLELGQRFAEPMNILQRVAENAHRDPKVSVRLQNLLLLVQELPGDPVTIEALRTACSDWSPQIRLRAAQELGAEGRDILLGFAESTMDDALSAGAVLILDRELPVERMRIILDNALGSGRMGTARACLEVLGKSGDAAAVDVLAQVLASRDGETAIVAAQALGTTGSPAAEPSLILALQRKQTFLQLAAASSLGRVGSAAAVLPLKEVAESAMGDPELRRATRQAIAEIQSRLPGASPGQLSVAEAEAGQLSLAPSEGGKLSLASSEVGQVSLAVEPFPLPPEEPEQPSHRAREEPAGRLV